MVLFCQDVYFPSGATNIHVSPNSPCSGLYYLFEALAWIYVYFSRIVVDMYMNCQGGYIVDNFYHIFYHSVLETAKKHVKFSVTNIYGNC